MKTKFISLAGGVAAVSIGFAVGAFADPPHWVGTVAGASHCIAGSTLVLHAPDGTPLESTTAAEDGDYVFADYTASDGYEVRLTPPTGCVVDEAGEVVGESRRDAHIGDTDAVEIDFEVSPVATEPMPQPTPSPELTPSAELLPNTGAADTSTRAGDLLIAFAALVAIAAAFTVKSVRRR